MPRRFRLSNDTQVCQRLVTSPEFKLGTEVAELKSSARLHSCGQKALSAPTDCKFCRSADVNERAT